MEDYYMTDTGMKTADTVMEFDPVEIRGSAGHGNKIVPVIAVTAGVILAYMLFNK